MRIAAQVRSSHETHEVRVVTNDHEQRLSIAPKATGYGSAVNGGELLFLALATCYCNDIYREAAARGIRITSVEVEVSGQFGGVGDPARNIEYRANVQGEASPEQLSDLMRHTDTVAEVQNTLRTGVDVRFVE